MTDKLRDEAQQALERYGAGDGEPVAWMGIGKISKTPQIVAFSRQTVQEHGVNVEIVPLSTPTDLQASYARGLEDAASIVENADTPDCGGWTTCGIAEEIRALKGK